MRFARRLHFRRLEASGVIGARLLEAVGTINAVISGRAEARGCLRVESGRRPAARRRDIIMMMI